MYQVKVSGGGALPMVVDVNGNAVANARVKSIGFPHAVSHAGGKTEHYISGPGTAVIEVNGQLIADVPLC